MATLTFYQSINMLSPLIMYGTITETSQSRITINNFSGSSGVYFGSFVYGATDLIGGVVTGYDSYRNYRMEYKSTGAYLDAVTVKRYLDVGDALGLWQYALSGDDDIYGSSFADTLVGWSGNDFINGGGGDDVLIGFFGNDTLVGGPGNDYLQGGPGLDLALFTGTRNQYVISASSDGWIEVRDTVANRDGTDYVKEVERIRFSNLDVALDVNGVAGQAYRIYQAAFDRAPDATGLGYWINVMDNGASLTGVAGGFIGSAEFQSRYGNTSDVGFIKLLYENVLDRQPDAGGYAFWQEAMGRGLTREGLLAEFSESLENKANVEGLIANGIGYTPFIS